jgi:hypothetical protein
LTIEPWLPFHGFFVVILPGIYIYVKEALNTMPFQPGNTLSNGRPKGSPNETTRMVRETFAALLQGRESELQEALDKLRDKDPKAFLEYYIKVSERFVGPVSRQELTGLDGEKLEPITVILPSKPNE